MQLPTQWFVTLIYACIAVGFVVIGVWITRKLGRRVFWAEQGKCLNCGYDQRGNTGDVCPECGHAIEKSA